MLLSKPAAGGGGGSGFAMLADPNGHMMVTNVNSPGSPSLDTTGATLIVMCLSDFADPPVPADSYGNTWTLAVKNEGYYAHLTFMFYTLPPVNKTGAGHTFSCPTRGVFEILAFSGPVAANPLDQVASSSWHDSYYTTWTSPAIAPSVDKELIVTNFSAGDVGANLIGSVNSPFILTNSTGQGTGVNGGNPASAAAYYVQPTAGSISSTWTMATGGCLPNVLIASFISTRVTNVTFKNATLGNAASLTVPAVGTGNCLVIMTSATATACTSITDGKGNTYTMLDTDTAGFQQATFCCTNVTGGPTTITGNHTGTVAMVVLEYSGVASFDPTGHKLNYQAYGTVPAGADLVTSGSVTPSVSGCMVVGITANGSASGLTSQGTNFISRGHVGGSFELWAEDRIQATAASIQATFSSSGGVNGETAIIVLR